MSGLEARLRRVLLAAVVFAAGAVAVAVAAMGASGGQRAAWATSASSSVVTGQSTGGVGGSGVRGGKGRTDPAASPRTRLAEDLGLAGMVGLLAAYTLGYGILGGRIGRVGLAEDPARRRRARGLEAALRNDASTPPAASGAEPTSRRVLAVASDLADAGRDGARAAPSRRRRAGDLEQRVPKGATPRSPRG